MMVIAWFEFAHFFTPLSVFRHETGKGKYPPTFVIHLKCSECVTLSQSQNWKTSVTLRNLHPILEARQRSFPPSLDYQVLSMWQSRSLIALVFLSWKYFRSMTSWGGWFISTSIVVSTLFIALGISETSRGSLISSDWSGQIRLHQ